MSLDSRKPLSEPCAPTNITVGAYYYPWYGNDFHRGGRYVRKILKQAPVLGEYDDTDPAVISQHVAWSRQANIQLWVTSWWGPGSREDTTLRTVVLPNSDVVDNIKIAIHYETKGRLYSNNALLLNRVVTDIRYICENYFNQGNYFQIDGRPVLVVYLTRVLEGEGDLQEVIERMRSAAAEYSYDIYIIGDHAFQKPKAKSASAVAMLDAITNYDVYGSFPQRGYSGQVSVDQYFADQDQWVQLCTPVGCAYVPGVSPGFNDRGVRLEVDHAALARKLSPDAEPGSLFRESLRQALEHVQESTSNLLFVNSFNEWHEDSQIEPVAGEATREPVLYTQGIEYVGYGELYLDILGSTTKDTSDFQLVPRDCANTPKSMLFVLIVLFIFR
jgi:glycoprotein endo-alpha-1,2-mannosidase